MVARVGESWGGAGKKIGDIEKYKSVVPEQSWGCKVQHRE